MSKNPKPIFPGNGCAQSLRFRMPLSTENPGVYSAEILGGPMKSANLDNFFGIAIDFLLFPASVLVYTYSDPPDLSISPIFFNTAS